VKYLKISFFVLIAIFFGYWLVQIALTIWEKSSKAAVWSLIPADAVAVWQIPNSIRTYQQLDSTAIWQSLKTAPTFNQLAERAKVAELMIGEGIDLDSYFRNKQLTISLHTTAKGNFDFMFFIPITIKDNTVFRHALQNVLTRNQVKTEKRNYQGIEIQEVKFENHKTVFSYSIYKGYFVGSFTALLVEETIRNINELGRNNFYSVNKPSFSLEKPNENEIYVYFNPKQMPNFLKIFYADLPQNQATLQNIQNLQSVFEGGYYQTNIDTKKITFTGLQACNKKADKLTNNMADLSGLKPTPCDRLVQFLPQKTASLYRLSIDDKDAFFQRIATQYPASKDSLIQSKYIDFQDFVSFIEDEIAIATLEHTANSEAQKIVYIKVKNPLQLSIQLQKYANEIAKNNKDTLLYENFGGQKLVKLALTEFPEKLFGKNFKGFGYTHFTFLNNYLLLGNSPKALATVLEDVENDQVWAKTFQASPLLDQLAKPSSFCYVENVLRSWSKNMQELNPTWQLFFEQNQRQFLRFEFIVLQGEIEDEILKTSITLLHKAYNSAEISKNIKNLYETSFYNTVQSKPFVLKNLVNKSKEVLIQDAAHHLHLIAVNGKKLWHFSVGSPIVPQVYQTDLLNNRQTQYLFAATNKIYLLDRQGVMVQGFPIELADCGKIKFLSLLDYDNTKNYRIAAADENGNVFLLSKYGKILQGWQPKKMSGNLALPLAHIRAGSADALVSVTQQGVISLFKRNGDSYPDFPISVAQSIDNTYFLSPNSDFNKTVMVFLTTQGEIIKLSLAGKVVGREELERPFTQSVFKLLVDATQATDYLLCRQDEYVITFFNKKLTQIFSLTFANKTEKIVQYFNFGVHADVIAITDTEEKKTYLHYLNGDKVCEPIPSEKEVTIFFNEIKTDYLIYSTVENKVKAQRVAKL
jgi:hypothetical protein